jgi:hypothetical protein
VPQTETPRATVTAAAAPTAVSISTPTLAPPTPSQTPVLSSDEQRMRDALSVEVVGTKLEPVDTKAGRFSPFYIVKTVAKNKGSVGIRAYTGVLEINDVFDRNIIRANWTHDSWPIAPGAEYADDSTGLQINQFMESHKKLVNTPPENLRFVFIVKSILFVDGKLLGKAS